MKVVTAAVTPVVTFLLALFSTLVLAQARELPDFTRLVDEQGDRKSVV